MVVANTRQHVILCISMVFLCYSYALSMLFLCSFYIDFRRFVIKRRPFSAGIAGIQAFNKKTRGHSSRPSGTCRFQAESKRNQSSFKDDLRYTRAVHRGTNAVASFLLLFTRFALAIGASASLMAPRLPSLPRGRAATADT